MLQEKTIEEAAGTFAEAITASSDWKRFAEINAEFNEAEGIGRMLEEYQELATSIQSGSGQPSPEQARELESLQVRIQGDPLFQKREEAARSMLQLLEQANVALSNRLGINFAANAAPRQEGCCGGGDHSH